MQSSKPSRRNASQKHYIDFGDDNPYDYQEHAPRAVRRNSLNGNQHTTAVRRNSLNGSQHTKTVRRNSLNGSQHGLNQYQSQQQPTRSGRKNSLSPRRVHSNKVNPRTAVLFLLIVLLTVANILQSYHVAIDHTTRLNVDNSFDLTTRAHIFSEDKPKNGGFNTNDVVTFDHHVHENIQATYNGAHSYVEWSSKASPETKTKYDISKLFQAVPLSATVDRRPLMVRKQLMEDKTNKSENGKFLGCAMSSTTFLSNLESQYLQNYPEYTPTCDVCFQFSNREDMANFVPDKGWEPILQGQDSTATKCFGGVATMTAKFAKWQNTDERFTGFGYPWTVDCMLPNGIPELTCREISRMEGEIAERDDLQKIYFQTKAVLDGWVENDDYDQFFVRSSWPWRALMSHDDDRSKIAKTLSYAFDDTNSAFVPKSARELKLAHVEGPGYDMGEFEGSLSLKSMNTNPTSRGGVHFRLISNLFHLIRNAPGSTHMIAVVDGQAKRGYENLLKLLETKVSDLYPNYGQVFQQQQQQLQSTELIPISKMKESKQLRVQDMTLLELLRHREIKIHMVPIITPSIVFEKTVCGGQYQFATYLAARYAPDYHAIMFIDGDTAMVEKSTTLQNVLYDRFFSENSSKCAGHRLRLIEQYVQPENDSTQQVLACTADLSSNQAKWDYAMKNCHLKEGHIVARTDSIYAFSVHHPDTLPEFLPEGVEDCITPPNIVDERYFLSENEFVQLHLRNRQRKAECSCFVNQE